jgi:uncharacterized protein YggE
MENTTRSLVLLLAILLISNNCSAQDLATGGIVCQGESVLERKPEVMRMSVDLRAKGEKMADAIAKLKERRTNAEKRLIALGAAKETWKFGEVRLDKKQISRRAQLRMLIQQRAAMNGGQAVKENDDEKPTPVDLTMKLTAEWPLSETDDAERLGTVHKLQEAIRETDIGGAEDADDVSEEEAEVAEEMDGVMVGGLNLAVARSGLSFMDGDSTAQKPGAPSFVFVAKIPAADRQKAMNEAFLEAKAEAVQLAQAAQHELGALKSLSCASGVEADDQVTDQTIYYTPMNSSPSLRRQSADSANEAIGTSSGTLKYKITVNATFAFK